MLSCSWLPAAENEQLDAQRGCAREWTPHRAGRARGCSMVPIGTSLAPRMGVARTYRAHALEGGGSTESGLRIFCDARAAPQLSRSSGSSEFLGSSEWYPSEELRGIRGPARLPRHHQHIGEPAARIR